MQGVGEAPWGSRAQMLGFCFLDILPTTCEGPCVSGHLGPGRGWRGSQCPSASPASVSARMWEPWSFPGTPGPSRLP